MNELCRRLRFRDSFFAIAALSCLVVTAHADPPEVPPKTGVSETIKLFDGETLDGWEGDTKYWSVDNHEIVGKYDQPIAISSYLVTKRKFSDFRLLATVKMVASKTHSGIGLWGHLAPEHGDPFAYAGHLVMFPKSWGLYDLYGRLNFKIDNKKERKAGKERDWNKLEILAQGNRIRVVVNGVAAVDWRDPEPDRIKEGPIALQMPDSQSPTEVRFKELILTTFPEEKLTTEK